MFCIGPRPTLLTVPLPSRIIHVPADQVAVDFRRYVCMCAPRVQGVHPLERIASSGHFSLKLLLLPSMLCVLQLTRARQKAITFVCVWRHEETRRSASGMTTVGDAFEEARGLVVACRSAGESSGRCRLPRNNCFLAYWSGDFPIDSLQSCSARTSGGMPLPFPDCSCRNPAPVP